MKLRSYIKQYKDRFLFKNFKEDNIFHNITRDLEKVGKNYFVAIISSRGFHTLLHYRIANWLWKHKIPVIPSVLTRISQIMYSIDIDYRAKISGGITIRHGVGLVVGYGAEIQSGCIIYHGVTLGAAHGNNIGFPVLKKMFWLVQGPKY